MRVLRRSPQAGRTRYLRGGGRRREGVGAIVTSVSRAPLNDHQEITPLPDQPAVPKPRPQRRTRSKPSCESCYFGLRMLCALELGAPCSTFRPDSPQGLMPPTQPMLLIGPDSATASPELLTTN